jgi:hypothetical protein
LAALDRVLAIFPLLAAFTGPERIALILILFLIFSKKKNLIIEKFSRFFFQNYHCLRLS